MNILLISGATGAGTTSIASAIAKECNVLYVVGTDSLREAARQLIVPEVNPYLHRSSYLAGKSHNYASKNDDIKKEKIVRGFKTQCSAVKVCVDGVIKRYIREESPLIVEGIHLIPGNYQEIVGRGIAEQVLIDIEDSNIHMERIKARITKNPARGDDYLRNFQEIRWIRNYLLRKALNSSIEVINNSGNLEETVRQCLRFIH